MKKEDIYITEENVGGKEETKIVCVCVCVRGRGVNGIERIGR